MNDAQKARVIANCEIIAKALREGKEADLQLRYKCSSIWGDSAGHGFDMSAEYRLKPEPRTIWVNEYPNDGCAAHDSEASARDGAVTNATRIAVEYREVVK